jgi:hypothetical protein
MIYFGALDDITRAKETLHHIKQETLEQNQ